MQMLMRQQHFVEYLRVEPCGLTENDIFHMFSNIEVIFQCHEK